MHLYELLLHPVVGTVVLNRHNAYIKSWGGVEVMLELGFRAVNPLALTLNKHGTCRVGVRAKAKTAIRIRASPRNPRNLPVLCLLRTTCSWSKPSTPHAIRKNVKIAQNKPHFYYFPINIRNLSGLLLLLLLLPDSLRGNGGMEKDHGATEAGKLPRESPKSERRQESVVGQCRMR